MCFWLTKSKRKKKMKKCNSLEKLTAYVLRMQWKIGDAGARVLSPIESRTIRFRPMKNEHETSLPAMIVTFCSFLLSYSLFYSYRWCGNNFRPATNIYADEHTHTRTHGHSFISRHRGRSAKGFTVDCMLFIYEPNTLIHSNAVRTPHKNFNAVYLGLGIYWLQHFECIFHFSNSI